LGAAGCESGQTSTIGAANGSGSNPDYATEGIEPRASPGASRPPGDKIAERHERPHGPDFQVREFSFEGLLVAFENNPRAARHWLPRAARYGERSSAGVKWLVVEMSVNQARPARYPGFDDHETRAGAQAPLCFGQKCPIIGDVMEDVDHGNRFEATGRKRQQPRIQNQLCTRTREDLGLNQVRNVVAEKSGA
jgi:hypothetical protein